MTAARSIGPVRQRSELPEGVACRLKATTAAAHVERSDMTRPRDDDERTRRDSPPAWPGTRHRPAIRSITLGAVARRVALDRADADRPRSRRARAHARSQRAGLRARR